METSVKQIDFSVVEKVVSSIEDNDDNDTTSPYSKIYYLQMHILFNYNSLVGENLSGSAVDSDTFEIFRINYDESGNVSSTVATGLPSVSDITNKANDIATTKADSLINEERAYAAVNSYINEISNLTGITRDYYNHKSGLDEVEGN